MILRQHTNDNNDLCHMNSSYIIGKCIEYRNWVGGKVDRGGWS